MVQPAVRSATVFAQRYHDLEGKERLRSASSSDSEITGVAIKAIPSGLWENFCHFVSYLMGARWEKISYQTEEGESREVLVNSRSLHYRSLGRIEQNAATTQELFDRLLSSWSSPPEAHFSDRVFTALESSPIAELRQGDMRSTAEKVGRVAHAHFTGQQPLDAPRFVSAEALDISRPAIFTPDHKVILLTSVERGRGAFKQAYECLQVDFSLGEPRAQLKIDLRVFREAQMARDEEEVARAFDSPHVIASASSQVTEPREGLNAEGTLHLIKDLMEYDLQAVTDGRKRLSLAEKIHIALGAARGLAAIHERNCIHRDIKPANIMVDSNGDGVVIDLGFVEDLDSPTYTRRFTANYCPPEVLVDYRRASKKGDVWALGATFYRLFHPTNSRPPFQMGGNRVALREALEVWSPFSSITDEQWSVTSEEERRLRDLVIRMLMRREFGRLPLDRVIAQLEEIEQGLAQAA